MPKLDITNDMNFEQCSGSTFKVKACEWSFLVTHHSTLQEPGAKGVHAEGCDKIANGIALYLPSTYMRYVQANK